MNIVKATHNFERWLGEHIELIPADLRLKHESMAESPFNFFRATFYRWMQLWPEIGPDLAKAPRVLAVGDLHVENFGTWRDIEGRLIWGINDFDEAAILPYTLDLVRLASSAMLAIKEGHLSAKIEDICAAIMDGYRESLAVGGRPYVLEEQNSWLREIALNELRDPVHFWKRIDMLPKFKGSIPKEARKALDRAMPEPKLPYELRKRVAGLGSLGTSVQWRLRTGWVAELPAKQNHWPRLPCTGRKTGKPAGKSFTKKLLMPQFAVLTHF